MEEMRIYLKDVGNYGHPRSRPHMLNPISFVPQGVKAATGLLGAVGISVGFGISKVAQLPFPDSRIHENPAMVAGLQSALRM